MLALRIHQYIWAFHPSISTNTNGLALTKKLCLTFKKGILCNRIIPYKSHDREQALIGEIEFLMEIIP